MSRVVIVGGGLAGLATATALAPRGLEVAVLEAKTRLGGRASSAQDATSGQLIDLCQHVSMGCCTNLAHFFRTVGVGQLLQPQQYLYFMTPDRRVSSFAAGPLPAPLHLLGAFARLHTLTWSEKARVAWGLACLRLSRPDADPPLLPWLLQHGQTRRTIERFWGLVLVSALNEAVERLGLRYARKVFVEGFLGHRRGFEVELPTVPLGRLYGDELQGWLTRHGVRVVLNTGVRSLVVESDRVRRLELRDGTHLEADWYVSAVPFDRLLGLLPSATSELSYFAALRQLELSPITSVHLWYDRPVMRFPHVVLVDCLGQWVFNRGDNYLQVVVSAARNLRQLGHDEIERRIVAEMATLFPAAEPTALRRVRVITEHAATFSAVAGVDRWRPQQESPLTNLFVAGDWTATGWPATMEGAIRSGYLAAEVLLRRLGRPEALVQPDLSR